MITVPNITYLQFSRLDEPSRLRASMVASIIFHAVVLFGITFALPIPKSDNARAALEVVLVNSKTESKPVKADARAQHNLDGGGNTDADLRASTPFPELAENQQISDLRQAKKRQQMLEAENKKMLTQVRSKKNVPLTAPRDESNEPQSDVSVGADLSERSLEIVRLEARIEKDRQEYEKRPRRTFIGSKVEEAVTAHYVEGWRTKVERIGTLNFPAEAKRKKIYGDLKLTVAIRADGSLESVVIDVSSGKKVLDDAALRIVRMGAPYSALSAKIRLDTDILHITKTWTFTSTDELLTK